MRYSKIGLVATALFLVQATAALAEERAPAGGPQGGASVKGKGAPSGRPNATTSVTCGNTVYQVSVPGGTCTPAKGNGGVASCSNGDGDSAAASCANGCGLVFGEGSCTIGTKQ